MRVERTLVGLLLTTAVAMAGCQGRLAYNLPPAARLMEPGPGVTGPGPGVIPTPDPAMAGMGGMPGMAGMGGGVYPVGYNDGGDGQMCPGCGGRGCDTCHGTGLLGRLREHFGHDGGGAAMAGFYGGMGPTSQIAFLGADGVQISWDTSGSGMFDSSPLVIPGRQDFFQAAIYRLKLNNIPGRPGVELYPTLEVAPVTPRTDAYLAHSPIPVQFTEEDFDQALSGNFVTKVIYLPDPEFQELALAGVETLVSTRLDPGTDPIAEADRRGSILAIIRLGNKDLESSGRSAGPERAVPGPVQAIPSEMQGAPGPFGVNQTSYEQAIDPSTGQPAGGVVQAQYCYGAGGGNMPVGMPTAGFAPPAVPPNMIATSEWGMPITGTPIGLPGPPHIPLGTPAGLQAHVMKNKTKVMMPPPVTRMDVTVKQRPGLNYPRPVDRVRIDEAHREQFRLLPTWLTDAFTPHHQQPDCN